MLHLSLKVSDHLRYVLALILFAGAVSALGADAPLKRYPLSVIRPDASATPTGAMLAFRMPFSKPSHDDLVSRQGNDDAGIVKFTEGTGIRLRDGKLVSVESEVDVDRAARRNVTKSNLEVQLALVNDALKRGGATIERLVMASEAALRKMKQTGEELGKKEIADLDLYYALKFPKKAGAYVVEILNALNQFDVVEFAGPRVNVAPPPTDISPTTPLFSANQGYFAAAPAGINVPYARNLPGGRGEGVTTVDVEDAWIPDHEDFPILASASGVNYVDPVNPLLYSYHGTAVIGVVAGTENAYGITGIAPASQSAIASPVVTTNGAFNMPDAIVRAYNQSANGDIILIEQQVIYSGTDGSFCPPEWDQATFDYVKVATLNGRIVVETAGNGSQNMDDQARFGTRFIRSVQDSGAIYVGAGSSSSHTALSFSNYGSRNDLQGWGENIATLAYGLSPCNPPCLFFPSSDVRQAYTGGFGGTSGAAPIVSGAAALVQGIRIARGLPKLQSVEMRNALLVGATPQTGAGGIVGPLPNLQAVINTIPLGVPTISATGSGGGIAVISWTVVPGVNGYEISRKDSSASSWVVRSSGSTVGFTDTGLISGKTYLYRVRSVDGNGNDSVDSNYEIATTIDFTDPTLSPATTPVKAKHLVELRTAVNAICTFAGPTACPSVPFSGTALDENYLRTQQVKASDIMGVGTQITSLRSAIGASPVYFTSVVPGNIIRTTDVSDLRTGAN